MEEKAVEVQVAIVEVGGWWVRVIKWTDEMTTLLCRK